MPNIIETADFAAPKLDIYARLTEGQLLNRYEPDKGVFTTESPKVIGRALDAGCVPISTLAEKKHVKSQAWEITQCCGGISVYATEFDVLTQLTGLHLTRGMFCVMYRSSLSGSEKICEGVCRIAVLENVMNPINVGAIFRSAVTLNTDGVLLTSACSNPSYRRTVQVGVGTVLQILWTFLDSRLFWPQEGVGFLWKPGSATAAMALNDDSVNIDDSGSMLEEKLAIILGTEGDGPVAGTIAGCDYTVRIPMSHGVDPLNVAAASTIAFWQLGRR